MKLLVAFTFLSLYVEAYQDAKLSFMTSAHFKCEMLYPPRAKLKDYLVCAYRDIGVLDENGMMNRRRFVDLFASLDGNKIVVKFDICVQKFRETAGSVRERIYEYYWCMYPIRR